MDRQTHPAHAPHTQNVKGNAEFKEDGFRDYEEEDIVIENV